MSGMLALAVDVGTIINVRAVHLYDPLEYFGHVSGRNRLGIGVIKIGPDFLVPSCEYERDICCYVNGGRWTRNEFCPHLHYANNGQISASNGLACWYKQSADAFTPAGHFISTTTDSTDKFRGRYYDTYDSQLHRDAGVSGVVNYGTFSSDISHGSLFRFDMSNVIRPTYFALVAATNIDFVGLGFRHGNTPLDDTAQVYSYSGFASYSTYNYYTYRYLNSGKVSNMYESVYRSLHQTVTIDGTDLMLYAISYDPAYAGSSSYGNAWTYFESPYILVTRGNTSAQADIYILDECYTIHLPQS